MVCWRIRTDLRFSEEKNEWTKWLQEMMNEVQVGIALADVAEWQMFHICPCWNPKSIPHLEIRFDGKVNNKKKIRNGLLQIAHLRRARWCYLTGRMYSILEGISQGCEDRCRGGLPSLGNGLWITLFHVTLAYLIVVFHRQPTFTLGCLPLEHELRRVEQIFLADISIK